MSTKTATDLGSSWAIEAPFRVEVQEPDVSPIAESLWVLLQDISASTPHRDASIAMVLRALEQSGSTAYASWPEVGRTVQSEGTETSTRQRLLAQRQKNEAAIRLLREWMADESGYDERVWPIAKRAIEENRTSHRSRFSE